MPQGQEKNWIRTVPGRGWFPIFRFYGPLEPFCDKTWKLNDVEKLSTGVPLASRTSTTAATVLPSPTNCDRTSRPPRAESDLFPIRLAGITGSDGRFLFVNVEHRFERFGSGKRPTVM